MSQQLTSSDVAVRLEDFIRDVQLHVDHLESYLNTLRSIAGHLRYSDLSPEIITGIDSLISEQSAEAFETMTAATYLVKRPRDTIGAYLSV